MSASEIAMTALAAVSQTDPALLLAEYRQSFGGSARAELSAEMPLYVFLGASTVGMAYYGTFLRSPLLRGLCWFCAAVLFGVSGLLVFR